MEPLSALAGLVGKDSHHAFLSEGPGPPDIHFSPNPVPQPHLPSSPTARPVAGSRLCALGLPRWGSEDALGSSGVLGLFASGKPLFSAYPGSGLAQTPCSGLETGPGSMALVPLRTCPIPAVGHSYTGASGS